MAQTGTNTSSAEELFDTESVCFELDDRAGTFLGWVRHQDSLASPAAPGGVVLFAANDIPAVPAPTPPATEPAAAPAIDRGDPILAGYTLVSCEPDCCATVLGEGCWEDGAASGRWISIRDSSGAVTITDPATGLAVDSADVVGCPPVTFQTELEVQGNGESFTVPGGGIDLVAWSVLALEDGVQLSVGASTATLDTDDRVESATPPEEGAILQESPQVVGAARILYQQRT